MQPAGVHLVQAGDVFRARADILPLLALPRAEVHADVRHLQRGALGALDVEEDIAVVVVVQVLQRAEDLALAEDGPLLFGGVVLFSLLCGPGMLLVIGEARRAAVAA